MLHDRKWQVFAKIYNRSFTETVALYRDKALQPPSWVDKTLLIGVSVLCLAYFVLVLNDPG